MLKYCTDKICDWTYITLAKEKNDKEIEHEII